ncbi:beta-glucosidase 46-like [Vigna unguiculata]|uniref:beta-glucosidase 46-like n=1 Tax=Vigna unguiculata TaxID=3917 RepID=UPI001015F214|nr:beta-glucosidase 46-like [Vigna unguiculata]XP_027916826.1 beta-glucosidase 46-like [Vigna unguiculata]
MMQSHGWLTSAKKRNEQQRLCSKMLAKALFGVILLLHLLAPFSVAVLSNELDLDLSPLPTGFLFGTASSSYQYEGAYNSDGKGMSNWDNFTHGTGRYVIYGGKNGDIANDHYHRYLEDIDLMEALGVNSYRLSISWARILPKGRFGEANHAGIDFYNRLIDVLILKGIQPFVTLSHYDSPQELEDRYGSWLSPQSQEDFAFYADLCFKTFGDRVKYWVTFNEPNFQVPLGYRSGIYPPCRCSGPLALAQCSEGDSKKEPFVAAHNVILAHAAAVDIYRTKYQTEQKGSIGIVLQHEWYEPLSNSTADKLAAERARSFTFNWFLDPIILGKYPTEMENLVGSLLPKFSSKEKEKLKKGLDFIGVNYYTAFYVQDCMYSTCQTGQGNSRTEGLYIQSGAKNGVPIGEPTKFSWFNIYPDGMEKALTYVRDRYNNTPMFITENGYAQEDDPNSTFEEHLNDSKRIKYMMDHIEAMVAAIRNGADVRGYLAWSLLDSFEWIYGYTIRYGFHHVDFATLKRTPRLSATWYKQLLVKYKEMTRQEKLLQNT